MIKLYLGRSKGGREMITDKQRALAERFKNMHKENKMFLLPNAWDAGSAYIFEKEGFKAIGTSSAGIAYSLGYPDGEDISFDDLLLCVKQIVRRIDIPLSVDFEHGYGDTIEQIKTNAYKLLSNGVVGFNIEDGRPDGTLDELEFITKKIKALVELKKELKLDFTINARTCTYWLNVADEETKFKIAVERGNSFKEAGADCVFIPGAVSKSIVKELVEKINSPINIILNPEFYNFKELESIGVRRLSLGSGPVRSVFNHLINLASNLQKGNVEEMLQNPFTYNKANVYFDKEKI